MLRRSPPRSFSRPTPTPPSPLLPQTASASSIPAASPHPCCLLRPSLHPYTVVAPPHRSCFASPSLPPPTSSASSPTIKTSRPTHHNSRHPPPTVRPQADRTRTEVAATARPRGRRPAAAAVVICGGGASSKAGQHWRGRRQRGVLRPRAWVAAATGATAAAGVAPSGGEAASVGGGGGQRRLQLAARAAAATEVASASRAAAGSGGTSRRPQRRKQRRRRQQRGARPGARTAPERGWRSAAGATATGGPAPGRCLQLAWRITAHREIEENEPERIASGFLCTSRHDILFCAGNR